MERGRTLVDCQEEVACFREGDEGVCFGRRRGEWFFDNYLGV